MDPWKRILFMSLFLVVFLTVYGLMHTAFYYRVRALVPSQGPWRGLLVFVLAILLLGPVLEHSLAGRGLEGASRIVGYAAYLWMGFLFLSLCAGLGILIYNGLAQAAGALGVSFLPRFTGKGPALLVLAVAATGLLYGLSENRRLEVSRFTVLTDRLPPGVERLRIVQISDIHLGVLLGEDLVREIVAAAAAEKPDVLVATGDFTDLYTSWRPADPALFKEIRPRLGAWAVTGNHEAYFDHHRSLGFIREAGFTLLEGEAVRVKNSGKEVLAIAGVDDPAMGIRQDEQKILRQARSSGLFTLLLKHQPIASKASRGLFDLQLSGHSHGGQIFPFHLLARLPYTKLSGRADFPEGGTLYVNRGTGYWGPPIRICSPREITVIDLLPAARKASEKPDPEPAP